MKSEVLHFYWFQLQLHNCLFFFFSFFFFFSKTANLWALVGKKSNIFAIILVILNKEYSMKCILFLSWFYMPANDITLFFFFFFFFFFFALKGQQKWFTQQPALVIHFLWHILCIPHTQPSFQNTLTSPFP